jgi:hypothetical protein
MMKRCVSFGSGIAAALLVASVAPVVQAATVSPTSYSMDNGDGTFNGGTYNYWDLNYSGSASTNVDGSPLSGGLGDLTDGVIATDNWFNTENGAGTGPYVGWLNNNPIIDFFFDAVLAFTSVTFYVDDADGAGGVSTPGSITVNGTNYLVSDPLGDDPFAITLDLTGLEASALNVQIFAANQWVFVSEVTFDGSPAAVPLPAGGVLMLGALAGLGALRRRKQRTA